MDNIVVGSELRAEASASLKKAVQTDLEKLDPQDDQAQLAIAAASLPKKETNK